MISEGLLFARRLGVEVADGDVATLAERTDGKLALDGGKRIIELLHEDAAHGIDDQDARAVLRGQQRRALSRRAGRIVQGPDQFRRALYENQRLALVPSMIAERDDVGAGVADLVIDRLGNAEAAGGVLAVDRDEVEPPALAQPRQAADHHLASGPADDVAEEEKAHQRLPAEKARPASV